MEKKELKSFETKKEKNEKFKEFKKQWTEIVKSLKGQLGQPTFQNIESNNFSKVVIKEKELNEDELWNFSDNSNQTNWRDDMKWENKEHVNAYLYMFGNNQTGYRQMCLAIYGE